MASSLSADDCDVARPDIDSRQSFSLRAFSEMKDVDDEPDPRPGNTLSSISAASTSTTNDHHNHHFVPHDLYKHPPNIVELNGQGATADDTVIKRLTLGKVHNTAAFDSNQSVTKTTPRRPSDKHYLAPTNTFIASNGEVFEIEPFVLPPPTEIAALFQELKGRRDRSDSNLGSTDHSTNSNSPKHSQKDISSLHNNHGTATGASFINSSSSSNPFLNNNRSTNGSSSSSNSINNSRSSYLESFSPDAKPSMLRPPNIFTESSNSNYSKSERAPGSYLSIFILDLQTPYLYRYTICPLVSLNLSMTFLTLPSSANRIRSEIRGYCLLAHHQ